MTKKPKTLTKELAEEIRIKFVQGIDTGTNERKYYTLDALAIENNISRSTLYKRAQKESWKAQQERFNEEFLQKLDASRQKVLVEESKKFDSSALSIAKIILNEVGLQLSENSQKRQADPNAMLLTPQLLQNLAQTAAQAQKLGKLALGESTENMKLNAEVTDTDAFREAMELLDSVAEQRRETNDSSIH